MENDIPLKLSIPEWSEADRPRERLLANGPKALSDAEIATLAQKGAAALFGPAH